MLTLTVVISLTALPVFGEDKKIIAEPENEAWKQLMALSIPDENHQLLAKLVGTWNYAGKEIVTDASQKTTTVVEFTGKAVRKSLWGGRYFLVELTGDKTKIPWLGGHEYDYQAMGIDGYDRAKKKFFIATMDNLFDSGLTVTEGNFDSATNTITYGGEMEESPGVKTKYSISLKLLDNDHYTVSHHFGNGYGQLVNYVRTAGQ